LGEKEQGLKDLKDAIKLKFSNPIPWHFMALYYKEEKNYESAIKNYTMAIKHDKENFNILREQSYLQIHLRQFQSFFNTTKRCIELKPNLIANWITYSFASYLQKEYSFSEKILDSAISQIEKNENKKPTEYMDILCFKLKLKIIQENYKEALEFITKNKTHFLDSVNYYEQLVFIHTKLGNLNECLESLKKLSIINPDNMDYYINRLNIYLQLEESEETKKLANTFSSFSELLKQLDQNPNLFEVFHDYVKRIKEEHKDNQEIKKSGTLYRLELATLPIKDGLFEKEVHVHFEKCIFSSNTSIIISIEWVYKYLRNTKVSALEKIFDDLSNELETKGTIYDSDLIPIIAWFNFAKSIHLKNLMRYEESLNYINKAIDTTPSVIEFFDIKSTILKKVFMFNESEKSYEKARKFDIGDRYLNAKHAKAALRTGDLALTQNIMQEFVKDPIDDENIEHIQTCWYINNIARHYLTKGEIPQADRLLKGIISIFHSIYTDQIDFFNYCLRRNVISHLIRSMEFMDKVFDNNNFYKSLELIEFLFDYIESVTKQNLSDKLEKEYKKLNDTEFKDTIYKFSSLKNIKNHYLKELQIIIIKLQSYSKNENFHYMAVKFSLINDKLLCAYKSLNYLKINHDNSIKYLIAKTMIAKYLQKNNKTSKNLFLNNLYNISQDFKDLEKILQNNKNEFSAIQERIFDNKNRQNFESEVLDNFSLIYYLSNDETEHTNNALLCKYLDHINSYDYEVLKHVNYKYYTKFYINLILYKGKEEAQKWEQSFKQKFIIFNDSSKTTYNLDMYDIFNDNKKPKLCTE